MTSDADEPTHGREYPPLRGVARSRTLRTPWTIRPPGVDPGAQLRAAAGVGPAGYPPPSYAPAGYAPPGYATAGLPTAGPAAGVATHRRIPAPARTGYDPYAPGAAPGTNGKAIAALVCSLVGPVLCCGLTSLVGLILGILAMRETKRTGQEGHGMALAGTIIGAIGSSSVVVSGVGLVVALVLASAPLQLRRLSSSAARTAPRPGHARGPALARDHQRHLAARLVDHLVAEHHRAPARRRRADVCHA